MQTQEVIQNRLKELREAAERSFELAVKNKMQEIINCQGVILEHQAKLKKHQQELKEMKLEHTDHSALFQ